MENMRIYDAVRSVRRMQKRPISGGRLAGKTDINPMWRIKTLTEQFGPCGIGWYYKPVRKWTEALGDEVAAFVDIELYVKDGESWSMPIAGTGGSMLAEKQKGSVYVSDECFKMATTDAISVACKQLGIGADVYWDADGSKYNRPGQAPSEPAPNKAEETPEERQRRELLDQLNTGELTQEAVKKLYAKEQAQPKEPAPEQEAAPEPEPAPEQPQEAQEQPQREAPEQPTKEPAASDYYYSINEARPAVPRK